MKTIGNQLLLYFKLHTGDGKQRGENLLIFGEDKNDKNDKEGFDLSLNRCDLEYMCHTKRRYCNFKSGSIVG